MTPPLPATAELGLDADAQKVDQLARDILRDDYIHFHLDRMELVEDPTGGNVEVRCRLSRSGSGEVRDIDGRGVGLVDAFMEGVMKAYGQEYPSLKTISVTDFQMGSGFDKAQGRRSDAAAVAKLRVANSEGIQYEFTRATPSVTHSSVRVALDALTFFINSERAYVQLHLAMKDAKERRRSDLVERYRSQMATLVQATSYSEVIERIRKEQDG
jgi:hypothetical protein